MARPSFQVDDEVEEFVEDRLIPGQSKSVWYRYAVETVMAVDPILDEEFEKYDYEEWQAFIEEAVREKFTDQPEIYGELSLVWFG